MYPHKKSALHYLLKEPRLLMPILSGFSKKYFWHAFTKICGGKTIDALQSLLPHEFAEYIESKNYVDSDGVHLLLYAFVRKYKPEIFVETGVSTGISSTFILAAMEENKKGHLYSIDLPPYEISETNPVGKQILSDGQVHRFKDDQKVGYFVPDFLKSRWTLTLGDSKRELPLLLDRLGSISVFFHDSLHTYEHMKFEFQTAWPHIAEGGFVLSHDILWNLAFNELCKEKKAKPIIYHSLGLFQKMTN
jgi:hypothetical protein